jgi:calcineurin-like phosphoesterase family protein
MKIEHQNIFFISDLHLGHKNIIKYDNRPFESLDQMSQTIETNWNKTVSADAIVFFLGDLSLGKGIELIKRLNGKKYAIMGNHDSFKSLQATQAFERIYDYGTEIKVVDKDAQQGYSHIIMAHYPILVWNRHHHGSWHLHGHCHGTLMTNRPEYYKRKVIDVGCNVIDYTPISYQEVKKIMNTKTTEFIDHHTNNTNE